MAEKEKKKERERGKIAFGEAMAAWQSSNSASLMPTTHPELKHPINRLSLSLSPPLSL